MPMPTLHHRIEHKTSIISMQQPTGNNVNERMLIIDREQMICELLQFKFSSEGFDVSILNDGQKALTTDLSRMSLILVDLMDQPFTGLDFTSAVKRNPDFYQVPVIIMSKQNSVDDVVNALDVGADDFVAKPFSTRELLARVRSVLRRRRMMANRRMSDVMTYRGLSLNIGNGIVTVDGESVGLSRTEFLILAMFLRHRNQFFDRAEIQHEAWEGDEAVSDRAVDTNISRLRKKIGEYGRNIVNRHGYGYGFIE